MKFLIINADDFGMSEEINLGICRAFSEGVITDTSILIRSPYASSGMQMANQINMAIGLHIDFFSPFVKACTHDFGPDSKFYTLLHEREFEHRYIQFFTCAELICIRNEIRNQIKLFKEIVGTLPTHLDYHFGLHYLPEVMSLYLTVAEEYKLPVRWGSMYAGSRPASLAPDNLCDHFRGLKEGSLDLLLQMLNLPWDGVMEFVCHPGYFTPGDLPDIYNQEREYELAALIDDRVKQTIKKNDIQLVNFTWLANHYDKESLK